MEVNVTAETILQAHGQEVHPANVFTRWTDRDLQRPNYRDVDELPAGSSLVMAVIYEDGGAYLEYTNAHEAAHEACQFARYAEVLQVQLYHSATPEWPVAVSDENGEIAWLA
jgi:hypothetical protein